MSILFAGIPEVSSVAEPWGSLVGNLGVPIAFMAFLAALTWRYAPRVIDGHLDHLKVSEANDAKIITLQEQTGEALGVLSDCAKAMLKQFTSGDGLQDHPFSTVQTNRALRHHAEAVMELASMEPGVADRVRPHVEAMRRALGVGE